MIGHRQTSKEAYLRVLPGAANLRAAVYSYIVRQGISGATDEEICDALDMGGSTERPRRIELVEGDLVVETDRRRYTKSGRLAIVWVARKHLIVRDVRQDG